MKKTLSLILALCMLLGMIPFAHAEAVYQEAPMLAEKVAAGELPAVKDRLPEDPLVVKVKDSIGTYGGTWRQSAISMLDTIHHIGFYGGNQLLVWDETGKEVVPNIAAAYEVSEDATAITITLRKGLKWSDGAPFGMHDVEFWWECLNNPDLTPSLGTWEGAAFAKVDDYTFTITFANPMPFMLTKLAFSNVNGTFTDGSNFFRPSHYLKQFHKDYVTEEELKATLDKYGASDWITLFMDRMSFTSNYELPTMAPFMMTVDPATTNQVTFTRNPYYWAVDEEGKQLPYIDACVINMVESIDIGIMKAIAGETDVQITTLSENFANYPLLAEHMEEQNYTLGTFDPNEPNAMNISINTLHRDADKRAVLGDKNFRIALSYGVNREDLVASFWTVGPYAAKIAQSSPIETSPYYSEQMSNQYTEFKADEANRMLDELGMNQYDAAGWRLSPSGKEFSLVIQVPAFDDVWIEIGEAVAQQWRNNLKLNVTATSVDTSLWTTRMEANDFDISMQTGSTGLAVLDATAVSKLTGYDVGGWGVWWQSGAQIWRKDPSAEGAVEPDEGTKRLWEIGAQIVIEPNPEVRDTLAKEMIQILADNFYVLGLARRLPSAYMIKNNVHNVYPLTFNWDYGVSGNTRPEAYWIEAQ